MFCSNCGQSISDSAHFCPSCGNTISALNPAAVATSTSTGLRSKNLEGLSGWLVLVILGLFATALFQLYGAYESITLFANGSVDYLSDPSSEVYIRGYSALLRLELIGEILVVAAALYLIVLFFRKSKKFPKYYLPYLLIVLIYAALDYALAASLSISHEETRKAMEESLPEHARELGRAAVGAIVWGSYITKSRRVKATFVRD